MAGHFGSLESTYPLERRKDAGRSDDMAGPERGHQDLLGIRAKNRVIDPAIV